MKAFPGVLPTSFLPYAAGIVAIFAIYLAIRVHLGHRRNRRGQAEYSADELIGLSGTVSSGAATRSNPAQAVVKDRFDQSHQVQVEPHHHQDVIQEGDKILLIRRIGTKFFAVAGEGPIRI